MLKESFTGIQIAYYVVCKRKLWLFSHQISFEKYSDHVELGKLINEEAFKKEKHKELEIGDVKIDFIKTKNGIVESDVINRLKAGGIDENIYTWEEAAGFMSSVTESFLSINILISFVGVLIAAVTIFIIIYVDIINKRREIGILRAIGIKPYIIFTSYIIKAAAYSVGGVLLGSAIFFGILVPYFNLHPFVLPICDAVLVLTKMDFIARAETIMWVAVLSALIPSVAVTRSKILTAIFGK